MAAGGMGSPAPGRQQPEVLGVRSEGGACWYRPPLGAPARHPRAEVPAPSARTPCCSRRTLSPSWCHRAWREGAVKQVGASLSDPGTARGVRRAWGRGGCDGPPGAARARALGGKAPRAVLEPRRTLAPLASSPTGAVGPRMSPEPHGGCDSGAPRAQTSPRTACAAQQEWGASRGDPRALEEGGGRPVCAARHPPWGFG